MKRFRDGGGGITRDSLYYMAGFLKDHPGFAPKYVCTKQPTATEFAVTIKGRLDGRDCKVLLSGCGCGYRGEGPRGTASVLLALLDRSADVLRVEYERTALMDRLQAVIGGSDHVHFFFHGNPPDIGWKYQDKEGKGSLALSTLIEGDER